MSKLFLISPTNNPLQNLNNLQKILVKKRNYSKIAVGKLERTKKELRKFKNNQKVALEKRKRYQNLYKLFIATKKALNIHNKILFSNLIKAIMTFF